MAVRTTFALVGKIIEIDPAQVEADFIAAFITPASNLVDRICATVLVVETGLPYYSNATLELIERWLSAHFYAILDPRNEREHVSRISVKIESKVDLGLNVTRYGQMAMTLDDKGGLAAINSQLKKGRVTIRGGVKWLGTPAEDIQNLLM